MKPAVIGAAGAVAVAVIGGVFALLARPSAPESQPTSPPSSTSAAATAPLDLAGFSTRLAAKGAEDRHAALLELSDAAGTLAVSQRQPVTNLLVRFIRVRAAEFTGVSQPRRNRGERTADPRATPDDLRLGFQIVQRVRSLGGTTVSLQRLPLAGVDLDGVNFSGFDLTDADFFGSSFEEATFERANLTRVWLRYGAAWKANFTGATLHDANLTGAGLADADLSGAKLTAANLSGADLTGASIANADLSDANITGTKLQVRDHRDTVFGSPVHCDAYTKFPGDLPRPTCVPPY